MDDDTSLLNMGSLGLETVFVEARATARHLRKSVLVVTSGPDEGREFVINKHKTYGGRSSVNDILLTDKGVSGTHFVIEAEEDGYILRDLKSTNGTYLGDVRIREIFLKPRLAFRIGETNLTFRPLDDIVEIPLSEHERFGEVIGQSVAMREIFATLEKIAPSELTVLIEGETGTGKERVARSIHAMSRRSNRPYAVLDCSAIPKDLMESMVFGHEKGAFTGAVNLHKGLFEQAHGGTILLDEVGELDLSLQPKLLRVLENRELKRVGGDRTIRTDVRVIAATNRDLRTMISDSGFREDLYFRLSVIQVLLPPLRDRREDIHLLVEEFLREHQQRLPCAADRLQIHPDAMEALLNHPWPGNVREVKNVIERAVSLLEGSLITRSDLQLDGGATRLGKPVAKEFASAYNPKAEFKDAKQQVVDRFEQHYLSQLIEGFAGNITRAARSSGLTRYHLRSLLKKHGLTGK